jgi:hypothetical protein
MYLSRRAEPMHRTAPDAASMRLGLHAGAGRATDPLPLPANTVSRSQLTLMLSAVAVLGKFTVTHSARCSGVLMP